MRAQPSERKVERDRPDRVVSAVAKKTFFRILDRWQVRTEDGRNLLGSPSRGTFFAWKKGEGGTLSRDTLERISYVIGIYKGLQILFPDPAQADAWISKPNEAFAGRSALDRMMGGNVSDLHAVRAYIDHVRGGLS